MMKSEKETFRLAEILVRSFREELSHEEQAKLEDWLKEDESHQQLYRRYASEEFLEEKSAAFRRIDWEQDYQKFIRKYAYTRQISPWKKGLKYAAIFILPVALGLFLWFQSPEQPVKVAEMQPVRKGQPVLTLAGGQKIVLTDTIRMQETDGTLVAAEAGELSYRRENRENPEVAQEVIYNYLEIPRGAEYFLMLADGTEIWLNSESTIRYPVNFTATTREVYIDGEVFFKVAKDSLHPFVVHTGDVRIEVLGTEFNVRNYKEEETVATTLVEGSVRLSSSREGNVAVLKPGEQGNIGRTDGVLTTQQVDTYLYTAWKDSRFVFRNTRMEDLLNTLARWYDLTLFYQNPAVKDIRFTGDMSRMEDFHQLLNIIENNERVTFAVHQNTVTVSLK